MNAVQEKEIFDVISQFAIYGDLRLFYDYVRERTARTPFTRELASSISRMKQEKEERNMYLTYSSRMMESRQDGYAEGLHTGLATGREQGISIGLERGLATGREEGAYQTKLETARSMLSRRLPADLVVDCTNLPLETVEQLASETTNYPQNQPSPQQRKVPTQQ